jgi:hypothetical protein
VTPIIRHLNFHDAYAIVFDNRHAFATLSFISETFLFLYVGMDALDIEKWKIVSETYRYVFYSACDNVLVDQIHRRL